MKYSLIASVLVLSMTFSPAYAFRLPVGTVQAEKRLEPSRPSPEDVNDSDYDLTQSAAVVSMLKLLAHYLPQQVYFLNSDPSPNYPSISIISLLIKLAASAKVPDKKLTLPPPVITTEGPVIQDRSKAKQGKKATKLSIGQKNPLLDELDPESTVKKEQERKNRSIYSESLYDQKNLETTKQEETAEHNKLKTANLYSDFLAPSVQLNPPKENMQFLFWTYPQGNVEATSRTIDPVTKFEGSFVVSTHGTRFKSVHGRQFTLAEGKLLACNRQAELSFQTPLALVSLPPGTTALITATQSSLTVQALESIGKSTVTVAPKTGKKFYLAGGQQVDIDTDGKQTTSQFSLSQLLQKEKLIDAQAAYLNDQQASALADLLKRVSSSTTATGGDGGR